MPDVPTGGQLALLVASILLFAAGSILSLSRLWLEPDAARLSTAPAAPGATPPASSPLRLAAKVCWYAGVLVGLGVLVWHSVDRGSWVPLEDNFDALIWLGLLLALFVLYVQRTRPLAGLDWFVMPIVILLLVSAAVFGRAKPHEYVGTTWSWVHRVGSYGGAVAFIIAGAIGAMYLMANRRLRSKTAVPGPRFGSLERLEHLTFVSVTLGFALFTIGSVTGLVKMLAEHKPVPLVKLVLAVSVWLVYAI